MNRTGLGKKRCCIDHVFVLDSVVRNRLEEGKDTFTAFIDLQKAFDLVNREFLLFKILNAGIEGKVYKSIKSMYSINAACIRVNSMLTDWFNTLQGVRQGDSLSPTIFSLFINDLAQEIKNLNLGVTVNDKTISILMYADDIALVAPNVKNLQKMLNKMKEWVAKWHMKINVT